MRDLFKVRSCGRDRSPAVLLAHVTALAVVATTCLSGSGRERLLRLPDFAFTSLGTTPNALLDYEEVGDLVIVRQNRATRVHDPMGHSIRFLGWTYTGQIAAYLNTPSYSSWTPPTIGAVAVEVEMKYSEFIGWDALSTRRDALIIKNDIPTADMAVLTARGVSSELLPSGSNRGHPLRRLTRVRGWEIRTTGNLVQLRRERRAWITVADCEHRCADAALRPMPG